MPNIQRFKQSCPIQQRPAAPSVSPVRPRKAQAVLPPADRKQGVGLSACLPATTVAANATYDAAFSKSRGVECQRDDAAIAAPDRGPHAKRAGIGRHRNNGARKHWVAVIASGNLRSVRSRPQPAEQAEAGCSSLPASSTLFFPPPLTSNSRI